MSYQRKYRDGWKGGEAQHDPYDRYGMISAHVEACGLQYEYTPTLTSDLTRELIMRLRLRPHRVYALRVPYETIHASRDHAGPAEAMITAEAMRIRGHAICELVNQPFQLEPISALELELAERASVRLMELVAQASK